MLFARGVAKSRIFSSSGKLGVSHQLYPRELDKLHIFLSLSIPAQKRVAGNEFCSWETRAFSNTPDHVDPGGSDDVESDKR